MGGAMPCRLHENGDVVVATALTDESDESDDTGTTSVTSQPPGDEAAEIARIVKIECLLDSMNVASEELNALQKFADTVSKTRQKKIQRWHVSSARLVKAIGKERISRVAPFYRNQQLLDSARRQVAAVSAAFLKASQGCSSDSQREKLASRHAEQVAEYQAAQQKAMKLVRDDSAPPPWLLQCTAPYFQAAADHLAHLDELQAADVRCQRKIAKAKARYRDAMRGLEAMSEAEHLARAAVGGDLGER